MRSVALADSSLSPRARVFRYRRGEMLIAIALVVVTAGGIMAASRKCYRRPRSTNPVWEPPKLGQPTITPVFSRPIGDQLHQNKLANRPK
jgi:hypothetical protein